METLMVERTSTAIAAFSRLRTAGRLPEKTKITIIIKHLSAHVFIFSIAMALENVQNHFFGLKTGKVIPKLVFELEKGPISSLPLETQRTYLWKLNNGCLASLSSEARASGAELLEIDAHPTSGAKHLQFTVLVTLLTHILRKSETNRPN
jgi:hypothetical protein